MLGLKNLVEAGSLSEEMAEEIGNLAVAGANFVIVGNMSTGKTSLLNTLSNLIPRNERVVVIEAEGELKLPSSLTHTSLIAKKVSAPNSAMPLGMSSLIVSGMRMRADRIIIGEVRDGSAYNMLQAMNSGHDCMTTIHADGVEQGIDRLVNLALEPNSLYHDRMVSLIAEVVDIIVTVERDSRTDFRRISSIVEILPRKSAVDMKSNLAVSTLWEFGHGRATRVNSLSKGLQDRLKRKAKKRYTLEELYQAEEN